MSYKGEVHTTDNNSDKWYGNALRFATPQEAERYIKNLQYRWTSVTATRVVESDEPVNYQWDNLLSRAVAIATV